MSLTDWWAEMASEREGRTRRERHGSGEIIFLDEVPTHATGCRLPDGSVTDAVCLTQQAAMPDEVPRVWTRCLPGTALRQRGRLTLQPDAEPLFVDEVDADLGASVTAAADVADLERDLVRSDRVCGLVRSELFATLLYSALCNTLWRHKGAGTEWRCSWRHAGSIVATLRGEGCYLDWYCSMSEGFVDEQVLAEIGALGWELVEADLPDW